MTQGLLGAAAAQAALGSRAPETIRPKLWWLGALGGMAADVDILLRWPGDPMVALTYHRHFTHSLAFVPLGGLLVALPFLWRAAKDPRLREARAFILAATTIGYATHALLDAFTSYGTLLWWPFADTRVAWNTISIIDPIYTLALAVGVWSSRRALAARPARIALLFSCAYMLACGVQRARVRSAQASILADANFDAQRRFVFPGLLANTNWRSLSVQGDTLRADAIAVPWFGPARFISGESHARFRPEQAPAEMFEGAGGQRVREALDTIAWFGGDCMYVDDSRPGWWRVCDARYSRSPQSFAGLFCWELEPASSEAPVRQVRMNPNGEERAHMLAALPFSALEGYIPVPSDDG